jgi:hypothetical protein
MNASVNTTAAVAQDEQIKMAPIFTVPQTLTDNQIAVIWSRRSTDKNPVAAENRYRAVVLPASRLQLPDGACTSKFQSLLQSTIHQLAETKLQADLKDGMHLREVPEASLSLDAVLSFWAEEKQRQVIDASAISKWLAESATFASLNPAQQAVWKTQLPKIAAPSYAMIFNAEMAAVIVSKIADADLEHPAALFVCQRCNSVISKPATVAAAF